MNPREKNFYFLLTLISVFLFLIFFFFFQVKNQIQKPQIPLLPPSKSNQSNCGIENCHGLEITCGSNIPEVCSLDYQLGDKCRQFAKCQIVNGRCQLVEDEDFQKCKSCVENCLKLYENDPLKLFNCEADC